MNGVDKAAIDIFGRSLLDRALAHWPAGASLFAVGMERPTELCVTWRLEEPPGGGPLAGIAAALPSITSDLVGLVAVDLPLLGPAVPDLLSSAKRSFEGGEDGAWLCDLAGHPQPLAACVVTGSLAAAMPTSPAGKSVRSVLETLSLSTVPVADVFLHDTDTWSDVATVTNSILQMEAQMTEKWLTQICTVLQVDPAVVDTEVVLDLARDVAHGVERKAAPLTTFVVGYAAGAQAADAERVAQLAALIQDMSGPGSV